MRRLNRRKGLADIVVAVGLTILFGFYTWASYLHTQLQNKVQIQSMNETEGFYGAEVVAWSNFWRVSGGTPYQPVASLDNQYYSKLLGSANPYDPETYTSGSALNVERTREHDSGNALVRRYTGDNLTYVAQNGTDPYCGQMTLAGKSYQLCLAQVCPGFTCSATLCEGILSCPTTASSKPAKCIRTQADLQNMKSDEKYILYNDIQITTPFTPVTASGIILNGNNHEIMDLSFIPVTKQSAGLFGSLTNSVIYDLKLTNVNIDMQRFSVSRHA